MMILVTLEFCFQNAQFYLSKSFFKFLLVGNDCWKLALNINILGSQRLDGALRRVFKLMLRSRPLIG